MPFSKVAFLYYEAREKHQIIRSGVFLCFTCLILYPCSQRLGELCASKKWREYSIEELLWERPSLDTCYAPARFTVLLGHTPTLYYGEQFQNRMIKTDSWWNIDTGAATDNGRPMLLCLETCREYYIEASEAVIEC